MTTLTATIDLPLGPHAAGTARSATRTIVDAWGFADDEWIYDLTIVVSELVGNAVRHAGESIALRLDLAEGRVTVSVVDGSATLPRPRSDERLAEDGRGFSIIAALTDAWGVESHPKGKRVWARLPACPALDARPGQARERDAEIA